MTAYNDSEKHNLCQLFRELRIEAGLRQVDLAKRLRRPQSFVSKYESGEKTLTFIEVKEVCKALGISLTKFVKRFEASL
jgi:transcriptional regulator with XRE-family HTH domain